MNIETLGLRSAREDFRRARQQAALQEVAALLTGRSNALLSYEVVARTLRAVDRVDRGAQEIPLSGIVGSVGRTNDFTRSFLPLNDSDEERWARVKEAVIRTSGLPPIDVYKIGEAYFVRDGHHRVSIARQLGSTTIQAYVTEVRTRVGLGSDIGPDELIVKAEYAAFLEETRLDKTRPNADLSVSVPGQYPRLAEHIEVHRYLAELEQQREIPFPDAAASWYDEAYLPVVQAIRERGILRDFPGRTEADLYLWVVEHRLALERALGREVQAESAAADLAAQASPQLGRRLARAAQRVLRAVLPEALADGPSPGVWRKQRLLARYGDRLFGDILVPLGDAPDGWNALDRALEAARRETGRVHGLHVVQAESARQDEGVEALRAEFDRRCREAGVPGDMAIEAGDVPNVICTHAAFADLVVLSLAHPSGSGPQTGVSPSWRNILRHCPQPVLAVPPSGSEFDAPLLAYDGSPKSREALFVAAYMAETWRLPLTVVTVLEAGRASAATLDEARRYLGIHEVEPAMVTAEGPAPEAILRVAGEHACHTILLGGYATGALAHVVVGSTVEKFLRESCCNLLICR